MSFVGLFFHRFLCSVNLLLQIFKYDGYQNLGVEVRFC